MEICTKLVLAYDEKTKKPLASVLPKLVKKLKPHQVEGRNIDIFYVNFVFMIFLQAMCLEYLDYLF